ncbi:MAG: DNA repair protein RecO C-terminal domain-containing protein [Treponema sp.]|nr:DNA repair protein RecO C-terminal domain-containing protein [Treponema sp.]
MNRNVSKEALVLSVKETAQDNRSVRLLTKEGMEWATLFGGPKSKLRGAVSPWNRGVAYIYKNEEKQSAKITDFDVKKYHPTFRESLFKSFAASLAGEIVLKSSAAGSPEQCYVLLNGFLDGMDLLGEDEARLGLLRFLWRYLDLLGVRPQTQFCSRCQKEFFSGNQPALGDGPAPNGGDAAENGLAAAPSSNYSKSALESAAGGKRLALYSPAENSFVCQDCFSLQEKGTRLSEPALFYLAMSGGTSAADLAAARKARLAQGDYGQLKAFLYELVESALGTRLRTLESGKGIL